MLCVRCQISTVKVERDILNVRRYKMVALFSYLDSLVSSFYSIATGNPEGRNINVNECTFCYSAQFAN